MPIRAHCLSNISSTLYGLSQDNWSHIIEGNQLLYAFQVDEELADRLHGQSLQDFLAAEPSKAPESNGTNTDTQAVSAVPANTAQASKEEAAKDPDQSFDPKTIQGPNISTMSTVNPVIPISRSTRPGTYQPRSL
jgi:hypothetical protein